MDGQQGEVVYKGRTLDEWVKLLRDSPLHAKERTEARKALSRFGTAAAPVLIDLLVSRLSPDWKDAVQYLTTLGSDVGPTLVGALDHPNELVRCRLLEVIRKVGAPRELTIPKMIDLLEDENEDVRIHVVILLEQIGPEAAVAVPALARCLSAESVELVGLAASTLRSIGPASKSALPNLYAALAAIRSLPRTHPGIQRINKRLFEAVMVLGRDDERLVPTLIERLGAAGWDEYHEEAARHCLLRLVENDDAVLQSLIEALGNDSSSLRNNIAILLRRISPPPEAALPKLIEIAQHLGEYEREVVKTLAVYKQHPEPVVAALGQVLLTSEGLLNRTYAIEALSEFGVAAAAALPGLAKSLNSANDLERSTAHKLAMRLAPDRADEWRSRVSHRERERQEKERRLEAERRAEEAALRTARCPIHGVLLRKCTDCGRVTCPQCESVCCFGSREMR